MGDRQSVEVLQWLPYMGRTRINVTHAGNGREVHLLRLRNVKVDGYFEETNDVFEYVGCFWHVCTCMPNRHKPIGNTEEILLSRYEETEARLKEIEDAGYKVVSIWGCQFRELLHENPGFVNEYCSHPYIKNCPINIRNALYVCRTEATKTYYRVKQGKKSIMWTLSVCTPTFVNMGNFVYATRKRTCV